MDTSEPVVSRIFNFVDVCNFIMQRASNMLDVDGI